MQQAKLIVLKIRTLPDLKKMCGDGKVTFARRLTKLQHYHGGARKERERRNDSCDCSSSLPVNRRHSASTLSPQERRSNGPMISHANPSLLAQGKAGYSSPL